MSTTCLYRYDGPLAQQDLLEGHRFETHHLTQVQFEGTRGGPSGVSVSGVPVTVAGHGTLTTGAAANSQPTLAFRDGNVTYMALPDGMVQPYAGPPPGGSPSGGGPPSGGGTTGGPPDSALDLIPGDIGAPNCFLEGTRIRVPLGYAAIEHLSRGDSIIDVNGKRHSILYIAKAEITLISGMEHLYHRWFPVRIPVGTFGEGRPYRDTYLSQQHRILVDGPEVELVLAEQQALAPACGFVDFGASLETSLRKITYYHILCEEHVILMANGMPCETLFLGDLLVRGAKTAAKDEAQHFFGDLVARISPERMARMRPAAPLLRKFEVRAAFAHTL